MLKHARKRDVMFVVALVGFAIGFAVIFFVASRGTSTYLVNGLTIPLTFEVEGRRVSVAPGRRDELKLPSGAHVVKVTASDGRVVDELPVIIPRYFDAVVINPLGAAPVYAETVEYGSSLSTAGPGNIQFFGGMRVATVRTVNDPFRDPPRQISAKRGERVRRVHLALADGGARVTLGYLAEKAEAARAMDLAYALLEQLPSDESLETTAALAGRLAGTEAALRVYRIERQRRPSSPAAQSGYAYLMASLGRESVMLDELARARAERPDDPVAGVSYARVAPRPVARALYDELVRTFPNDADVGLSAAAFAFDDGRPADAIELYKRFASAPQYARSVALHAHALSSSASHQAVYDFLASWLDKHASPSAEEAAILAASLSQLPDVKGDARHLKTAIPNPGRRALVLAEIGLTPDADAMKDPVVAAAVKMVRRFVESSTGGLTAWDNDLTSDARAFVSLETRVVLLLEAARLGATLGADPLAGEAAVPIPMAEVLDYIRGGPEPPRLFRAHGRVRAAIEGCRARELARLKKPTADAEALVMKHSPGGSLTRQMLRARAEPERPAKKDDKAPKPKKTP